MNLIGPFDPSVGQINNYNYIQLQMETWNEGYQPSEWDNRRGFQRFTPDVL